jgi:hypothetical protein
MKTMKLTRRGLLGAASAAWAATVLSKPGSAAAEFDFKLGVNTPETHPLTIRLTEAAQAIGAQSSGRLNVTVFPNSQLGGDPEMLSQVRAGGIDLLAVPSLTLSTLVPMSGLPSIGFAFGSYDQVWAAMDGGVGDTVREAIGKAGIIPMKKIWDNGFRQITSSSNKQLNSVDDLKGFKIRVPVTALLTSLFSGLGAQPSSTTTNFTRRCRRTSSRGRKTRWRRYRPASSTRCRNTARSRTIAGAAIGSSATAARSRPFLRICSTSSIRISMQQRSRNVQTCWSWIARCKPNS